MTTGAAWSWDAATTAAAIKARKISSREVVEASLARLNAVNPAINAVVEILEGEALAAAGRADAALARGDATGLLHGVPVTAKINVDLAGHATTNGIVAFEHATASEDSSPVANLRAAGAIIIGRTNVPTFSYRWFTSNALHGRTHNPWNAALPPGGSSGGAAAAAATGIGTLAHGNDVAGSLRLPASNCGVYGMRPTMGRLPGYNPSQQVEKSLCLQVAATEGVLTRSVRDIRLGLAALEAPDHRDPWQVPPPARTGEQAMPCHVALFTGEAEFGTHPEIAAILERVAGWLEDAGYVVEQAAPPRIAEMAELWMAMLYAECTGEVRDAMFGLGDEAFRQSFIDTAANLPELDRPGFHASWATRLSIQREWAVFLERYPVLLLPSTFQPTFPMDHDLDGKETLAKILTAYVPMSSTAGLALPSISVPAGAAAGAPAGIQLVAGRFMDERCLAAAEVLEQRIGPTRPIDPVAA